MIWREKRMLLIVLGVLLAANTIFFFTYRVRYQNRLTDLDERLEQAENALLQARAARVKVEQTYRSYRQIETDAQTIFNEHWATQTERLTPMIAEVKRLTVASSLVPSSIGFSSAEAKASTTVTGRRGQSIGATEVGIQFGVEGSYEHVRRLINLLELSRQFVIIDGIGLAARDGEHLQFNLNLKTLFRDDEKTRLANTRL
jgi:hypothetical protein